MPALRAGCILSVVTGVLLLTFGIMYGALFLMAGILFGYVAMFRRCLNCGKYAGLSGSLLLAYANPFARKCVHCGRSTREPSDA